MHTIFLVCFLVGLALSVVSFVSGLDRINVFDHVFGHGHHGGAHHHGRVVVKHGVGRQEPNVSALNMAAITGFLAWFGGTGLVLQQATTLLGPAIVGVAVVVGLAGGSLVNRFLRAILRRERPLQPTTIDGAIARVTSSIREEGTGEIVVVVNGTRQVFAARADTGGSAIGKGEEVVVIRHERGIAYVCTWEQLSALTLES